MAGSETKASGQEAGKSRESFRDWESKLEDRLALHLASLPGPSTMLSWPVVDGVAISRQYRLTDKVAREIIRNNCEEMDRVRKILRRRCRNCDHVISADAEKSFEIPYIGAVCSLCHDIHKSVAFNGMLKNMNYFKELHEKWKKERDDDGSRGGWRDKAGM